MTISAMILNHILYRLLVLIYVFFGIFSLQLQNKFIYLIISGLISGLYYGYYNDIIWRPNSITLSNNMPYRMHQLWVHIICGFVGSVGLYLLTVKLNLNEPSKTLTNLDLGTLVVFIVTMLSYVGLLPRTLWFLSNRGSIDGK